MLVNGLMSLVLNTGPVISVEDLPMETVPRTEEVRMATSSKKDVQPPGNPLVAMAAVRALKGSRRFRLQSSGMTDVGRQKIIDGKKNEDAFFVDDAQGFYIVADGVGSGGYGEVASALAVKEIPPLVAQGLAQRDASEIPDVLKDAFQLANMAIFNETIIHSYYRGMATTAVALLIRGAKAYMAHAGDSRLYQFRAGVLTQMTKDHSWVNAEIDAGRLTPQQVRTHSMRHIITNSLGRSLGILVPVSLGSCDVKKGDRFLLCSDGLTEMVEDRRIQEILQNEKDPHQATQRLIDEANQNGGHDNITVIVVDAKN